MAYEYKIIIDDLPQKGIGNGSMSPDLVVIHHSAIETDGEYDVMERLSGYAQSHINRIGNPGLAYHFYIPRLNTDPHIYVTRYLNQIQWHCSNGGFNARSIAVLVEGDFETQEPTQDQLAKLKQLLDDLQSDELFSDNPYIRSLKPKDNTTAKTENGITITGGLAFHSEVAEVGFGTGCCGENLIKRVIEYRVKAGYVSWDNLLPTNASDLTRELTEARTAIESLTAENGRLQNEIEVLKSMLDGNSEDVKQKFEHCERETETFRAENVRLVKEIKRLKEATLETSTPAGITVTQSAGTPTSVKLKFMSYWNQLPVFVRYLIPNIISLAIPSLILWVQNFDLSSIEALGVIGISHTTIKSLIIGYLKNLDKKLKGVSVVEDFEE